MTEYSTLYHTLFNAITDACEELRAGKPVQALKALETAQVKTEDMYVEAGGGAAYFMQFRSQHVMDYDSICCIFSNTVAKSLRYLPAMPETTIARYLLQWSLLEVKDRYFSSLKRDLCGEPDLDEDELTKFNVNAGNYADLRPDNIDWICDHWDFDGYDAMLDYDYFDDSSEDLSGIDLTGFFPDDKPRKFQYRYGPIPPEDDTPKDPHDLP